LRLLAEAEPAKAGAGGRAFITDALEERADMKHVFARFGFDPTLSLSLRQGRAA